MQKPIEGILPINKPIGKTSFSLVTLLRRLTHVKKIGHTGTLDPFADGVMILLIGKKYTSLSDHFLNQEKEYLATLHLGITTDSYDRDGQILSHSSLIPTQEKINTAVAQFQGVCEQTPPMFSAKKIGGKKLYELARKGISIERSPSLVSLCITLITYVYPYLKIHVRCSKGTYIRSLAHDMGVFLECGAHLSSLTRIKNGHYTLSHCCDGQRLNDPTYEWNNYLHPIEEVSNWRGLCKP
jgi:tRNA pseudouridine55 synthase